MNLPNSLRNRLPAALLLLLSAGCLPAQNTGDGVIEGTVTDSVTGAGIAGTDIRIVGARNRTYRTQSEVTGAFRIAEVLEGEYQLWVHADGYVGPTSEQPAGPHIISPDQPTRVRVEMAPLGSISGTSTTRTISRWRT